MLTNLTNKKTIKMIVNRRGLRMRKLYRPYLPREAASGQLECWLLRKTPNDSSFGPSEESCM